MSAAALAADPHSGRAAGCAGMTAADRMVLSAEGRHEPTGFDFALRPSRHPPERQVSEPGIDRLMVELHRHSHDPDAIRRAAGAMRYTVESALWQSAQSGSSRVPAILSEMFGRAAGLYVAGKLRWLASTLREWLVLLSSPKRLLWAAQAAWKGEEIAGRVREKAGWFSVDEIAVFQRECVTPIVRVGQGVSPDEDDWLASNPVLCVTRRYLAGEIPAESAAIISSADEMPVHSMVVVGEHAEITARITGHTPPGLRDELQSLCTAADVILGDAEAGRAEWIFRLKQLVAPAVRKTGPEVARQFWNPLVILTVFLTAGAVLLGSAGVEHLRWEGVVKQIDAEPGIEVISHSAAWGRRQIEMLRDPQARQVAVLLLELGFDPAAISVRERPFLSAEEPLLSARQRAQRHGSFASDIPPGSPASVARVTGDLPAPSGEMRESVLAEVRLDLLRSTFDLPVDLDLALSGGELTARGSLAEPAYSRLAHASRKLTWLKKLYLDQVRDVTAENVAEIKKGLEQIQIEFAPASIILPEASKLRLQSVAAEMNRLAGEARLKRQDVRVQFRASHRDADEGTAAHRVEIIRRDLVRQGVPAGWFDPEAGLLDAPGPHVIAFRISLESPPEAGP